MKKSFKKLVVVFCSLLILTLAISFTAFASPKPYSNTLPTIGHKTLTSGVRETSSSNWKHTMATYSQAPSAVVWCDAWINGKWILATNNKTIINSGLPSNFNWDKFIPIKDTAVRLRAQGSSLGGKAIVGVIDFE
ncbi:MAG TPA: hypothetical protein DIW17_09460 [Clostridiales bacterium]|jgi:hypothetical protein|nr:hypothetical protein [Clostridiales bacterium]